MTVSNHTSPSVHHPETGIVLRSRTQGGTESSGSIRVDRYQKGYPVTCKFERRVWIGCGRRSDVQVNGRYSVDTGFQMKAEQVVDA